MVEMGREWAVNRGGTAGSRPVLSSTAEGSFQEAEGSFQEAEGSFQEAEGSSPERALWRR